MRTIGMLGGSTSGSGSVSESVSKGLEMGFGHEKMDATQWGSIPIPIPTPTPWVTKSS